MAHWGRSGWHLSDDMKGDAVLTCFKFCNHPDNSGNVRVARIASHAVSAASTGTDN